MARASSVALQVPALLVVAVTGGGRIRDRPIDADPIARVDVQLGS
ncbi:hypothetical protein [Actinomadura sp. 21ATH]